MFIGAHYSISGGIALSLERAINDCAEAVQIFVKNSNRWEGKPIAEKDAEKFKKLAADFGNNKIVAHTSYLINLASEGDVYIKSVAAINDELSRCDLLGVKYIVMHPGAHLGAGEPNAINKIVESVDNIYSAHNYNTEILLETTAGQGTNIGYLYEHIESIISKSRYSDKLGVCLDSCHMFSAGYDVRDEYDKVIDDVVNRFGDKLKVIHLNDSKKGKGSRVDRHEKIGNGTIGIDFFRKIVNDQRFSSILGILETPIGDDETYIGEIELLKSLRAQ